MFNRKKVKKLEAENASLKKQLDWLESELNREIGECRAYRFIADKFIFENRNTEIDDEGVIYHGKVYKIVGSKQIVDDVGDTVDLHCELVDPSKDGEKRKIGFKLENKEPKENKE